MLAFGPDEGAAAREAAPRAEAPRDRDPDDAAVARATRGTVPEPAGPRPAGRRFGAGRGMELGAEVVGRDAVWRTFRAPANGWYGLSVRGPGALWAVTVLDPDSHRVMASSRWQGRPGRGGAFFRARAGLSYPVSVGVLDGPGGDVVLRWRQVAGPSGLRHSGRLVDGGPDARGVPVEIRRPGELAFGGGRLYLGSGLGLTAFERDAATGVLAVIGHVESDLAGASLVWDGARGRVIAHDCGNWQSFPADGGASLDMGVAGDPGGCGRLLVDTAGDLVHRVGAAGLDTFAVGEDGALAFAGTAPVWGMRGAVVGRPGRVYAVGDDGLLAIGRDRRTGRFAAAPTGVALAGAPLAYDAAGERLLAASAEGMRWVALRKESPAVLPAPEEAVNGLAGCAVAALGPGSTVDVFCGRTVLSSGFDGGSYVSTMPESGAPVGAAASPDGQHVYVSTRSGGILTFARAFSSADDHGDGQATATRVDIPSTTAGYLDEGEQDYFRVDLDQAGSFTAETTGTTDTWGGWSTA